MNDLKTVKKTLEKFIDLEENKAFIFGSRANGTHRQDSDLDILIDDVDIRPSIVSAIEEAFEESDLLYKVDLVLKSRIDSDFFKAIEKDLKHLD